MQNIESEELELLKMLTESEEDVRNKRVKPISDSFEEMEKKLHKSNISEIIYERF